MPSFLALCLLSRLAYAFNDVLVGRLARRHGEVEIAALRGLSLGLTMAPLLLWVPLDAWAGLAARWPSYLLLVALTAASNVLQNRAARLLPFSLRAALMIAAVSLASVVLGAALFAERLSYAQTGLCLLLVASAILAALGQHAQHEIRPDIPKGAAMAFLGGVGLALAAVLTKRLASDTNPLLTAWAWEFGAGVILVGPWLWQSRRGFEPGLARRLGRTAAASAPTVIGSGASMMALALGALGLWGALAGTQVLFTAVLGVYWHRERIDARRWLCFVAAAGAVAGLALLRG